MTDEYNWPFDGIGNKAIRVKVGDEGKCVRENPIGRSFASRTQSIRLVSVRQYPSLGKYVWEQISKPEDLGFRIGPSLRVILIQSMDRNDTKIIVSNRYMLCAVDTREVALTLQRSPPSRHPQRLHTLGS